MSRTIGDRGRAMPGEADFRGVYPRPAQRWMVMPQEKRNPQMYGEKGVNRTSLDTRSGNGSAANAQSDTVGVVRIQVGSKRTSSTKCGVMGQRRVRADCRVKAEGKEHFLMAAYQNELYAERRVPDVLAPLRGLGVRDADVVSAASGASGAGRHSVGW
ncbi:hypothetical protein B0H13DRAFT_1898266 [Mycena leptocephala]|nr:hypothetical protein B0H13DRAFT_1898266 [Mycena leptocephala]